jgi:hypothetical protein
MIEINLFDESFPGQPSSVATQTPQTMRYVRGQTHWDGITVFTGEMMFSPIVDDVQSRYKVGWVNGDARCFRPRFYELVGNVAHKFDAVMTHDAQLLATGAPFVKTIRGGSWVPLDQWGMYPKSRNVSMILSEKAELLGHILRHAIANAGLPIDLYGPQYTPIGHDKRVAYRDYRFAVVVEACREENFFTEHLIDALAFGCKVFYWGCPNIKQYFDSNAMWPFGDVAGLATVLYSIVNYDALYQVTEQTVRLAQIHARAYAITEDWQIENCLRPFVEAL